VSAMYVMISLMEIRAGLALGAVATAHRGPPQSARREARPTEAAAHLAGEAAGQ
jgi:hypothetical protein